MDEVAHLQRSVAALRIDGDELNPDEVTVLLGATPTLSRAKGEVVLMGNGRSRIANGGQWHLEAPDTEPEDVDAQVAEILSKLTSDLSVWEVLSQRFHVDLFCGWFMNGSDEGLEISASTLASLGVRGIKLGVCIYAPTASNPTFEGTDMRPLN